jgi:hypothetical protein
VGETTLFVFDCVVGKKRKIIVSNPLSQWMECALRKPSGPSACCCFYLFLLTLFFGKMGQEGIGENSQWKAGHNRPIEGRTEQSTRSADGQKGPALTVGLQVRAIGRWQTRGSADGHEEGGNQRNTPDRN